MTERRPRVTIGMPVRQGGTMFAAALEAVRNQSFSDIEIIISDNQSTDQTAEISQAAAKVDPRIVYVRQEAFLSAFDNMLFVLNKARGEFFCWAAHDDLRSPDFLARLLPALEQPEVVLAFSDLEIMTVHGATGRLQPYDFDNSSLSPVMRMRKQALMQCYHLYGLWRTDALKGLPKEFCPWWLDLPMMMAAAYRGTFVHVPGPRFRYYEVVKTDQERAAYQDGLIDRGKLRNIGLLLAATRKALTRVGGAGVGVLAMLFVAQKNLAFARMGLARRVRQRLSPSV